MRASIKIAAAAGLFAAAGVVADPPEASPSPAQSAPRVEATGSADRGADGWATFITVDELKAELGRPGLTVIDVRSRERYLAGHVPGAINIPGDTWRTPPAEPGEGVGNLIFRTPSGLPDFQAYERLLGAAGLTSDRDVVVIGAPAGKSESTVPVLILRWLGVRSVRFVDGPGVEEWSRRGHPLSTEETVLPPTEFVARPQPNVVWSLTDVVGNIGSSDVVFLDCRTQEEWNGTDLRGNRRGGRIPGAKWLDSSTLLDQYSKKSISRERVLALLAERGITPDKTVVIYCQTGTRCSLPFLQLQDLGFDKVAIYDASWVEYGNRDDTPVETPEPGSGS